jgi:hypothetical protein
MGVSSDMNSRNYRVDKRLLKKIKFNRGVMIMKKKGGLVFGREAPFDEAFPEIENVEARIEEFNSNWKSYFNKKRSNPPSEHVECHNPLCQSGGFYIGEILRDMVLKRETHRKGTTMCAGRERMARRYFRPCSNNFKYEIMIEYKSSA